MKLPFRMRNQRLARRGERTTEDVAFTLLQLYRPRREDLSFGLFVIGDVLAQEPIHDGPDPTEQDLPAEEPAKPPAADPPAPDLHEAAAQPTSEEEEEAAQQAVRQSGDARPQGDDGYATVKDFTPEEISTGKELWTADLPKTVSISETTTTVTTTTVVVAPPTVIVEPEPPAEEPEAEPVADPAAEPLAAPSEPDTGAPEPVDELPPGVYVCIDQDIDGAADIAMVVDVDGDFTGSAVGDSTPLLTTYDIAYVAVEDPPEVPDSLWWAGWQKVVFTFQIIQWETWVQDVDVDIDQDGEANTISVFVEQDTWIKQKALIAISAEGDDTVLNITTQAVIYTEIEQYTKVEVSVGEVTAGSSAVYDNTSVDIDQTVDVDQDVFVKVDVADGLDLDLDALLGQISAVLQDTEVSIKVIGGEVWVEVCADQVAELNQTLSVMLEVDDVDRELPEDDEEEAEEDDAPALTAEVELAAEVDVAGDTAAVSGDEPIPEAEADEPAVAVANDDEDDDEDDDAAEQADEEALVELLDAAFASGEDVAFDAFFEAWEGQEAAADAAEEDDVSPKTVAAATEDEPAEPVESDPLPAEDDNQHHSGQ